MFPVQASQIVSRAEQLFADCDEKTRIAAVEFAREIGNLLGGQNMPLEHTGGKVTLGDVEWSRSARVPGVDIPIELVSGITSDGVMAQRLTAVGSGLHPDGDSFRVYDPFGEFPNVRPGMRGWARYTGFRGGNYVLSSLKKQAKFIRGVLPGALTQSMQFIDNCVITDYDGGESPGTGGVRVWNAEGTVTDYVWSGDSGVAFAAVYEERTGKYVFNWIEQAGGS